MKVKGRIQNDPEAGRNRSRCWELLLKSFAAQRQTPLPGERQRLQIGRPRRKNSLGCAYVEDVVVCHYYRYCN